MDIHIRYIDPETNLTKTSYLTSEFLLSSKADDLVLHLTNALSKFEGLQNLVSVAMDGPNVNWKMLADLKLKLEADYPTASRLIEFESCALHVIHGALKTGHATNGWSIHDY